MFPSILNTFNRPSSTDRLNSPSHSSLHNTVISAVGQIEAVIGLNSGVNASALGTLMYDIRSPDSNGGGHIQTAVKGGTGQTTFTKGDLLVATGPSVLSKLAAGSDGQLLSANSSTASGVQWGGAGVNKILTIASVISIKATVSETSILNVSIPGSILGTSNAIRATFNIDQFGASNPSILVKAMYGGGVIASVMISPPSSTSMFGTLQYTLLANANTGLQRGYLNIDFKKTNQQAGSAPSVITLYDMNTTSVLSDASQTMGMTVRYSNANASDLMYVAGLIVEKIT